MIHIIDNLNQCKIDKTQFINDVEAAFPIYKHKIQSNGLYGNIIRSIDKVEYFKGDYIETPFGGTSCDKLSSGCKALLLAVTLPNIWINFLEAGDNVLKLALDISNTIDIHIVYDQKIVSAKHRDMDIKLNGRVIKLKSMPFRFGEEY